MSLRTQVGSHVTELNKDGRGCLIPNWSGHIRPSAHAEQLTQVRGRNPTENRGMGQLLSEEANEKA